MLSDEMQAGNAPTDEIYFSQARVWPAPLQLVALAKNRAKMTSQLSSRWSFHLAAAFDRHRHWSTKSCQSKRTSGELLAKPWAPVAPYARMGASAHIDDVNHLIMADDVWIAVLSSL